VHPFLERHGAWLLGAQSAADAGASATPPARAPRVFVPLCGASLDMRWLREHGAEVVGVDVSELAFRRFFDAVGLEPRVDRTCLFERWSAGGYELLVGDVFDADGAVLGTFDAVYDRAALFALPAEARRRYASRIAELCRPGTRLLQVALEYDQSRMAGPPFAVTAVEIEGLYGAAFAIEPLERLDVLAANDRLRERGLDSLVETAYTLVRR
jgi:thiopurine S-methyltransferase